MGYKIDAACGCVRGKVRSDNQDNFCFNGQILSKEQQETDNVLVWRGASNESPAFAVLDGMGGEYGGAAAAHLAADTLCRYVGNRSAEMLDIFCHEANERICKEMTRKNITRMGTTVAAIHLSKDEVRLCNVGDSRIYRLRGSKLEQLSLDHTMPQPSGDGKARLFQHLGIFEHEMHIQPYFLAEKAVPGGRYLLCSDGLTDMISDHEIENLLHQHTLPDEAVSALIDEAMRSGGKDNITATVVDVGTRVMWKKKWAIPLIAVVLVLAVILGLWIDSRAPIEAAFTDNAPIQIVAGGSAHVFYDVSPSRKQSSVFVVIADTTIAEYQNGVVYALTAGKTNVGLLDRAGNVLAERELEVFP